MSQSASEILSRALSEGRNRLNELEAIELCQDYSIPVARTSFASDKGEAVRCAEDIGYPVVLKIVAPDIIHKSDVGGVVMGINSPEELRRAYEDTVRRVGDQRNIQGMLVQEMISPGIEVIIGMTIDPQFEQVLMFGLGGVFVEVFEDVSFRVAPIDQVDAYEMIQEIKGYPLLVGARGKKPVDLKSVVNVLLKVSNMTLDGLPISELDLNPVIVGESSCKTVDARVLLQKA